MAEVVGDEGVIQIRYPEPQSEGKDSLHKQASRSVVRRIAPDWKIEVTSLGVEVGYDVKLWPPAKAIEATQLAPGEAQVLARLARLEEKIDSLLDQLAKD